jgi:pimeloyl-ACP methyl ester carboxylesterase
MAYFRTEDGCSLYFDIIGDGPSKPAITFVNGTLQTTIYWKIIAAKLADKYRVLLYDGRGQGESELGEAPLTLERHVTDLKSLLDELNVDQTALVGLSHGARVALALSGLRPDLVTRLILCSTSTRSTYRAGIVVRSWYEILRRHSLDAMVWAAVPVVFGTRYLRENTNVLERIAKTIVRRNDTDALRTHLEALQHYPPLVQTLKKTPFPVLVVTGEDDPLVTSDGAAEIARICGGHHVEIKGAGHSVPAEAPDRFVQLVFDFLDSRG